MPTRSSAGPGAAAATPQEAAVARASKAPMHRGRRPPRLAPTGAGRWRSAASFDRHPGTFIGTDIVRARANDLVVDTLLDDVRAPAAGPRNHEQRREHRGRHAEHVVARCAEPVEVREHLLELHHHVLDALGNLEQARIAARLAQLAADFLDDRIARVADRVNRMAEADHDLLALDARADIRFGFIGAAVARDDVHRDFVRAAVFRTAQCTDRAGDRGQDVRSGSLDYAG